jgi:signal peptidase I
MKLNKNIIIENIKTIFYALVIAVIIRSLLIQPFYIPSSSMEPTMLIGDRLFVTKYSYGYSKHSFPFSPPIFKDRLFFHKPERGDVMVFKTTRDNRTDFIKRLIGLPGDRIQFIDGDLYINNNQVLKTRISSNDIIYCSGSADANDSGQIKVFTYNEKLSKQKTHKAVYKKIGNFKNSDIFIVPEKHYFFLGDNRDCSADSRYLPGLGYVPEENLVGKAQFIFFSSDFRIGSIFYFWKWNKTIRLDRFFKRII